MAPRSEMTPSRLGGPATGHRAWAGMMLALLALPCLGAEPIAVAVTIPPQAWLVEQIGGEKVSVTTLVEPGESPATYLPSDRQISDLMRSAVYFRIGVPCERGRWLDALERSGRIEIVDLRQGLDLLFLPRHHGGHGPRRAGTAAHGAEDPHVWLSPSRLRLMARTIAGTLENLAAAGGGHYRRRLGDFERRLDLLDAELRGRLAPIAGRSFMVFHPSWGYFARDFGLRQLPIEIEGKEPSDAEVTELVTIARREAVSVVFVQPQVSSRAAEVVARAIGGRVEVLDPLAADVIANLSGAAGRIAGSLGATAKRGAPSEGRR